MALESVASLTAAQRRRIAALAAAERADSGRHPLGQGARDTLAGNADRIVRHWLWHDPGLQAYCCLSLDGAAPVHELTADPAHPSAAPGMLRAVTDRVLTGTLWAHGDRAQARIAAALLGLRLQRELMLMARSIDPPPAPRPLVAGLRIRPFNPASDADAWLALNRAAFADLPDQSSVNRAELHRLLGAEWFDPAGFLVAERDGAMVGFHWTKVDPAEAAARGPGSGEVYVLAVAPSERGTGLAPALLDEGLRHLARVGMAAAHLYVEADNRAAVALYRRAGFEARDTDRQYAW